MTGNFSIIQDSKTERSWLRHEVDGEVKLTECPKKDFPYLRLLASLIRNSDNPTELMEYVKDQIENNND
jgi:Zn-dependent M16 (insulinase) family peptidase